MSNKTLNVGMVGYGFMARAHSNAWSNGLAFLRYRLPPGAEGGRRAQYARRRRPFAEMWGYESVESDWRRLIERADIDVIDICTPNDSHAEIAIAAAKAGKMVTCEKPLARTEAEGLPMVEAVETAGVPNMVWYNYRRVPAVTPDQAVGRPGPARPHLSLPRQIPAGLDDFAGRAAGRCRRPGGSMSTAPDRA